MPTFCIAASLLSLSFMAPPLSCTITSCSGVGVGERGNSRRGERIPRANGTPLLHGKSKQSVLRRINAIKHVRFTYSTGVWAQKGE